MGNSEMGNGERGDIQSRTERAAHTAVEQDAKRGSTVKRYLRGSAVKGYLGKQYQCYPSLSILYPSYCLPNDLFLR